MRSFRRSEKINKDSKLYGFLMGPGGLVDHNYIELTDSIIDEYRNTGGFDIIGSGRTKLEKKEQFDKGLEILKQLGITALVIIGGDDSNTNAAVLAEYYKTSEPVFRLSAVRKPLTATLKTKLLKHLSASTQLQKSTANSSATYSATASLLKILALHQAHGSFSITYRA